MAAPPPPAWVPLLHELVASEQPSEQAFNERVAELAAHFRGSSGGSGGSAAPTSSAALPIIRLVEALGPFLTSDSDAQRARATSVLAEVLEAVPGSASTPAEVRHLCDFFTARLTDWPAVRGALGGCLALISRRPATAGLEAGDVQGAEAGLDAANSAASGAGAAGEAAAEAASLPAPTEEDAVGLLRTLVSNVFVRALAQPDRALALRLLRQAALRYGTALLGANLDLLEYLISSVDGEKDPRCLLLSFQAVEALLALYHAQPEESLCHERLEESAEELFEVLACYFPVTFTPPPGDPNRISRDDLAAGLQASLAAEPLFAPHLVPLAMEKLSSTLRQAKLDSLSLLAACAESWGPAPLAPHASTLWSALRAELAAPAAEGLLPADSAAADELAVAAADCLARCVAAFQRGGREAGGHGQTEVPAGASLADAVLADASLDDLLACIKAPGQDPTTQRRSVLRAKAGARAAAALCRAGGAAGGRALSRLLPPLLGMARGSHGPGSWQTECLAWAALLELLQAAAAAEAPPEVADSALIGGVVETASSSLAAAAEQGAAEGGEDAAGCGDGGAAEEAAGQADRWPTDAAACSPQHAAELQLAALAAVLESPALSAAVQQQQVQSAARSALSWLLAQPSPSDRQQAAAAAPLTALVGGCHAGVLSSSAIPDLVAAAGQQGSAAAALAVLKALAAAGGSLQGQIVGALDAAIQQGLPSALAEGPAGGDANQLLLQLLQTAGGIVAASPQPGEAAEAGAAAASDQLSLAQHLFETACQQAQQAPQQAVPAALLEASADLALHSMRTAGQPDQQQALAASAAQSLVNGRPLGILQAGIACALLVPLRPEAMQGLGAVVPPAGLVERLLALATAQEEAALARWSALAAAAVLNKWPGDADSLAACASAALQQSLLPACGLSPAGAGSGSGTTALPAGSPAAWGALAAVTRGLAMRGHKQADAAVRSVVASLGAAATRWQELAPAAADASQVAGLRAAAGFLGAVLDSTAGTCGRPGLGRDSFAVAKPVWQQRLYTIASGQLLPLLQQSLEAAGRAEAAPAGAAGGPSAAAEPALASPPLLLALAQLLQAAPAGVLQQEQAKVLPWLLQCLAALQSGPLGDGELLQALLLLLSGALMSEQGRQQATRDLLPQLVPALLGLSRYRPSSAARETALQCLLLLLDLPYSALHPHRRAVARVLAEAVDDDRRSVRLQAARVRAAWAAP